MFIAEIGINHNGSLDTAKKLILVAKECGADVVKFQKRNPDICVPKEQMNTIKQTPWGKMTYLDYKKKIEFNKEDYDEIDRFCKEKGIKWTVSVWDIDSAQFIFKNYNIPFIKIASACITDTKLLEYIRDNYNGHVIFSTGMSTLEEIREAAKIFDYNNITVMLCNSSYPSIDEELDLRALELLKKELNIGVENRSKLGYSGHEKDILPTIMAKTLGAEVIERHITLDKAMWGTDQFASLEPKELKVLINSLNRVDVILGNSDVTVYPSEEKIKKKLRRK